MQRTNQSISVGRWAGAWALTLLLLAGCGGGSGSSPAPANSAPSATILLAGQVSAGGADADVSAAAGHDIVLSAASSADPDGDAMTYKWSIVSKPASSTLALANDTAMQVSVRPEVSGTYVFNLRVSDSKGAATDKRATVLIRDNAAPLSVIVVSATYTAQPTVKPAQAVSLGASIVLDAAGSTDADGDPVTTTWTLLEKPTASRTGLTLDGKSARFSADVTGTFKVRARGTDPQGAYSETVYLFEANNRAPETVVLASVTSVNGNAGQSTVAVAVGYIVSLSGATSIDPDGGVLTYAWSLSSKPAGSKVVLDAATGVISQITPDVLGDYVVRLTATDPSGATSSYLTTVSVNNQRPVAAITSNATPLALPSGPAIRLPVNTLVTLRGSASVDADGDALTYAWSMFSQPAGSATALSSASAATVQLTPDASGSYVVRLRVTDTGGAFSEQTLTIEIGNYAPVAVSDKNRVTLLAGSAASASAELSFDEDGDALTYAWAIDARPVGSSAQIAAPASPTLSFTPDIAGSYVASLTVSDGKNASVAYVNIRALAAVAGSVALSFAPLETRYSKGLDKLIVVASNPNTLKIIDPFSGVIKTVLLPLPVKSMNLSADGKLAAVLHENIVGLVDLETATLIRSSSTGGAHTDVFLTNTGMAYLIGQTGGQWVRPSVTVVNARNGEDLTSTLATLYSSFYGTQRGIFAASKNKVFLISSGLSPADINYFTIDPNSGAVLASGDSPYHGDYSMSAPFYLTGNEDLLFTSSGNIFRTDTLQYAGRLSYTGSMQSLSHSSDTDEALVLLAGQGDYPNYLRTYQASYKRFAGALFLPDTDITLPMIGGLQSYGITIFHSANGNHVAVVQTGSATQNGGGVKYYVSTR